MDWEKHETPSGTAERLYPSDREFCISYISYAFDTESDETAILDGEDGYFILKGDHRKDYEKLVPKGLKACLKYFEENKSQELTQRDTDLSRVLKGVNKRMVEIINDLKA